MSERILKALMQLFAIIAHPQSSPTQRRRKVWKYLKQQLDQETAEEYLELFDQHYAENERRSKRSKGGKYMSASSVRVLKICTQINEELVIRQKIVVLIQLLEFLRSDDDLSDQELEFAETVSDTFNFSRDGFENLFQFMLKSFYEIPENERILVFGNKNYKPTISKYINSENFEGSIKILRLIATELYVLRYESSEDLVMNGQPLSKDRVYILGPGSSVRTPKIYPIYYSDISKTFNTDENYKKIVFKAEKIEYLFKETNFGVQNLSFQEESGKLVGIIGSSGAGKTTLLNLLNGSTKPQKGTVSINSYDINEENSPIEGVIGHVSQDDLLIESLTVFENLYFNAKLSFKKYDNKQLIRLSLKTLKDIGLYDVRNLKVGSPLDKMISGGQRKRLNIALELIREPSVLFLDEPTSGLSSRDSSKIMDLLKNLALKGKLIFIVIHQPSSDIYKLFDRLLILDTGGYLIYNGNPLDAITYFKRESDKANKNESECISCGNVDPDQVFNIIESEVVDEFGEPTQTRRVSPKKWHDKFKNSLKKVKDIECTNEKPPVSSRIPSVLTQFIVFCRRDILSKFANSQYMVINVLETPLLAFLLAFLIRFQNVDTTEGTGYAFNENSNLPVYLFMAVIVSLFIGLTLSAEEIIKDRTILKREKFLNLSRSAYLMSKVVILFTISAFQAFIFTIIGNNILQIEGMFLYYWFALFSTWCFANLLGLIISDSFKTIITIYILIPFLLIPQLILSGIIVKFDKLNPDISSPSSIPFYGEIIAARWAYEALATKQFMDNAYERNFYYFNKVMSRSDYRKNYWLPIMQNKVNENERFLKNNNKNKKFESNIRLIRNELNNDQLRSLDIKFNNLEKLNKGIFDSTSIVNLRNYFTDLNSYYIKLYNLANRKKDKHLVKIQKSHSSKKEFINLKKANYNESLSDFVKNANDVDRIIEYKEHLYQKIDPIYKDPESKMIKAHFYAPRKMIFGKYIPTFWVNMIVIWLMTVSLYVALYYEGLKSVLNIGEKLTTKFNKYSKK